MIKFIPTELIIQNPVMFSQDFFEAYRHTSENILHQSPAIPDHLILKNK